MLKLVLKPGAAEIARETQRSTEQTERKARKKSTPSDAPEQWLWRHNAAVRRILDAVSKGAERAGEKAVKELYGDRDLDRDARVRASRAREDVVYFEILDIVGRAAEAAAARASGYRTRAAFVEAQLPHLHWRLKARRTTVNLRQYA